MGGEKYFLMDTSMRGTSSGQIHPIIPIAFVSLLAALILAQTSSTIVLAILLGILVCVISFTKPEAALYFLIFAMLLSPEFGQRTTSGAGFTLRLDDLLLLVIGFTWLVRMAVFKDLGVFAKTPLNAPIFLYLFVCILATCLGVVLGDVKPVTGFFFVLKYFEYFVVYFVVVNNVQTRKQVKYLIIALLLTCFIVDVVALAQLPYRQRLTAPFEGTAGEPNTLGGYLILMISLSLALLLTLHSKKVKAGLLVLLGLSIVTFLFTLSRGSYLAFLPAYLALVFFAKRNGVWLILFLCLGGVLSPVIVPKAVVERVTYTFGQSYHKQQQQIGDVRLDTSTSARILSWTEGIRDATTKRPLLGYGVTGYKFLDTQYIKVLVDTGYIGIMAFFFLLFSIFREARNTYMTTSDPLYKGVCLGFLGAFVGMLVHSLGANTFIIIRIMEPFWLWVGLIMVISRQGASGKETANPLTSGS